MADESTASPGAPQPRGAGAPAPGGAFLKAAAAKIKTNLELLLGKPVAIESGDPQSITAASVVDAVPVPGLALAVAASGAVEATLHCFVARPLTLAMICLTQLKSDEATAERLAGDPAMTAEDRAGVDDVASFIVAALGDLARDTTGGRIVLAPAEPRFVETPADAPVDAAESWVALESTVSLSPAPPSALVIAAPSRLAEAWMQAGQPAASLFGSRPSAAAAPAPRNPDGPPPGSTPIQSLWVTGGASLCEAARQAAADSFVVRSFGSLAEVLAAAGDGPPPLVAIFEVPASAEFHLDIVAAFRHHPALAPARFVVALAAPTRALVIRCAGLGLLDVIRADVDAPTLGARLKRAPARLPGRQRG